jgi:hypothetical protein
MQRQGLAGRENLGFAGRGYRGAGIPACRAGIRAGITAKRVLKPLSEPPYARRNAGAAA